MENKIVACIDVDGVILGIKQHHSQTWEDNIKEKDLFEDRSLMEQRYLAYYLHSDDVVGICFVSHNPGTHFDHHCDVKRKFINRWLDIHNLKGKHIMNFFLEFGVQKKSECGVDIEGSDVDYVLVDDGIKNLIDWESKFGKGSAVHINEFESDVIK